MAGMHDWMLFCSTKNHSQKTLLFGTFIRFSVLDLLLQDLSTFGTTVV